MVFACGKAGGQDPETRKEHLKPGLHDHVASQPHRPRIDGAYGPQDHRDQAQDDAAQVQPHVATTCKDKNGNTAEAYQEAQPYAEARGSEFWIIDHLHDGNGQRDGGDDQGDGASADIARGQPYKGGTAKENQQSNDSGLDVFSWIAGEWDAFHKCVKQHQGACDGESEGGEEQRRYVRDANFYGNIGGAPEDADGQVGKPVGEFLFIGF